MKKNNLTHSIEYYFFLFSICFFAVGALFIFLLETVVNNERYKAFIIAADTLGYNAMTFDVIYNIKEDRPITLNEIIRNDIGNKIKSPFSNSNYCSLESFVRKENNKYYITLICDNYVLKDYEFSSRNDIDIYYLKDDKLKIIKTIKH